VELNTPEILLVREFAALMDVKRNKCKEDPEVSINYERSGNLLIYILQLIGCLPIVIIMNRIDIKKHYVMLILLKKNLIIQNLERLVENIEHCKMKLGLLNY
jgi:hypothetical protein